MIHEHLSCKFKVKELTETGRFSGLAAVYGNVDLGKDVIEPGAFTKTLQEHSGEFPILWQHESKTPIGLGTFTDTPKGLQVEGQLTMEVGKAAEAYALMRDKVVRGLSIGYDAVEAPVKDGIRHLRAIRLWETSIVTFPMNELALVEGVKNAADFLALLKQIEDGEIPLSGEDITAAQKTFTALAARRTPAAKQDISAPDLHAVMQSLKQEIETWNRTN